MSDKYNGWTNYETWRVAMEFVDDAYYSEANCADCDELADYIRDTVTEFVFDDAPDERASQSAFESLASGLVDQFFRAVDWYEIAENVADTYDLFEADEEECA